MATGSELKHVSVRRRHNTHIDSALAMLDVLIANNLAGGAAGHDREYEGTLVGPIVFDSAILEDIAAAIHNDTIVVSAEVRRNLAMVSDSDGGAENRIRVAP